MKISICIPVYDMEDTIERCVRSALTQDYTDFEVLVTDNQSSDKTFEIASSIKDERLRVIRNEKNLGAYGNHNRCLEEASGEWVKFLHGDDELLTSCLSKMAGFVSTSNGGAGIVGCGAINFGTQGREINRTYVPDRPVLIKMMPAWKLMREGNFFGTPSMVMVHRERLLKIGGFDLGMEPAADGDCWINIMSNYDGVYLSEHLAIMRDDTPENINKRLKRITRSCERNFRQLRKWHKRDSFFSSNDLRKTEYGKALKRESLRFFDAGIYYLLKGKPGLMEGLLKELSKEKMIADSFFYYVKKKIGSWPSGEFKFRKWTESLKEDLEYI